MVSRKRFRKISGVGLLVAVPLGGLLLSLRLVLAGPGGVPPIIITNQRADAQFDCLQFLLNDPPTYSSITDILAYSSLWHIGTVSQSGGFQHSFYTGAQRRNTRRLFRTSFLVTSGERGYRVESPTYGLGSIELGGKPVVQDEEGLQILRAAFNDSGLKALLLKRFQSLKLDIQSVHVEKDQAGKYHKLSFTGPKIDFAEPFRMSWYIQSDRPTAEYVFLYD